MKIKFLKCKKCGKAAAIFKNSPCSTFCCGEEMAELVPGTTDGAKEKHVPVVSRNGGKIEVSVGSVLHPMEEKHFIEWIALDCGGALQFKFLNPGDEPKAVFYVPEDSEKVSAYEYCNLHGLWKSELS